jgi:hypothetical protein
MSGCDERTGAESVTASRPLNRKERLVEEQLLVARSSRANRSASRASGPAWVNAAYPRAPSTARRDFVSGERVRPISQFR